MPAGPPDPEGEVVVHVDHDAAPPSAPAPPERVWVTHVSHNEARVAFDAPVADNGAPVHHYEVSFPGQDGAYLSSDPEDLSTDVLLPAPGGDDGMNSWSYSGLEGQGADARRGHRGQRVRRLGRGPLGHLRPD